MEAVEHKMNPFELTRKKKISGEKWFKEKINREEIGCYFHNDAKVKDRKAHHNFCIFFFSRSEQSGVRSPAWRPFPKWRPRQREGESHDAICNSKRRVCSKQRHSQRMINLICWRHELWMTRRRTKAKQIIRRE